MGPRSRLSQAGCAALAALVLTLPGCGKETSTAAEKTAAVEVPRQAAKSPPQTAGEDAGAAIVTGGCETQVGAFVDSLAHLRDRLAVGLTYGEYANEVASLRASYGEVPVDRLAPPCLVAVGTPGERAFNGYLAAANAWGECLSRPGCDAAQIEATLQSEWRAVAAPLSQAQKGLREMHGRS